MIASLQVRPIDHWPGPMTKTSHRRPGPFSASWSTTAETMERELRHLNARAGVLLIAVTEADIRLDGGIRANARPEHPGVIVAFDSVHGSLKYPCDTFTDWKDNVRAIALGLEALRKVDRYGITVRGEQYTGFRALPAGASDPDLAVAILTEIAGLPPDPSDPAWDRYRKNALRSAHPDNGGDGETFIKVQAALAYLGKTS